MHSLQTLVSSCVGMCVHTIILPLYLILNVYYLFIYLLSVLTKYGKILLNAKRITDIPQRVFKSLFNMYRITLLSYGCLKFTVASWGQMLLPKAHKRVLNYSTQTFFSEYFFCPCFVVFFCSTIEKQFFVNPCNVMVTPDPDFTKGFNVFPKMYLMYIMEYPKHNQGEIHSVIIFWTGTLKWRKT